MFSGMHPSSCSYWSSHMAFRYSAASWRFRYVDSSLRPSHFCALSSVCGRYWAAVEAPRTCSNEMIFEVHPESSSCCCPSKPAWTLCHRKMKTLPRGRCLFSWRWVCSICEAETNRESVAFESDNSSASFASWPFKIDCLDWCAGLHSAVWFQLRCCSLVWLRMTTHLVFQVVKSRSQNLGLATTRWMVPDWSDRRWCLLCAVDPSEDFFLSQPSRSWIRALMSQCRVTHLSCVQGCFFLFLSPSTAPHCRHQCWWCFP